MTLKDLINKIQFISLSKNEKKDELNLFNKFKIIIYPTILAVTFIIYISTYNLINNQKINNEKNLENFLSSKDFTYLKRSFFESLKSPYTEFSYKIENNDSIGKILKKFGVSDNEIQKIIEGLKKKKLTNIYAGRDLNIVLKRRDNGSNNILSVRYPINNTLSVEIRKNKDIIEIRKNILKLSKKEVVIKNTINNNLYSAATEAGIEPNIIIEFARIYGFEIDFRTHERQQ